MKMKRSYSASLSTASHPLPRIKLALLLLLAFSAIKTELYEISLKEPATERHRQTTARTQPQHAIIHIGPHKTGTTSIQWISQTEELQMDGYELPYLQDEKYYHYSENQWNFANCFLPETHFARMRNPCKPELLNAGKEIAKAGKNLFVSSEDFSFLHDIKSLSDYLQPWDKVTIVLTYRRYYDTLQSLWSELNKENVFYKFSKPNESKIAMLARCYRNPSKRDPRLMLAKFKNQFENIKVLNFHDRTKDLVEALYCDTFPDANITCSTLKDVLPKLSRYNVQREMVYGELAVGAVEMGLIPTNFQTHKEMKAVVDCIRDYQEETLGLTKYDFQMVCPPEDMLNGLLDLSLEIENSMIPYFYDTSLGEAQLRSDFEKQRTTKLCDIDVNSTLAKPEWQDFFQSFKPPELLGITE